MIINIYKLAAAQKISGRLSVIFAYIVR